MEAPLRDVVKQIKREASIAYAMVGYATITPLFEMFILSCRGEGDSTWSLPIL
jgi:hypothetical protein